MTDPSQTSVLEKPIAAYLAHQRALGRGYNNEARVLDALRRFAAESLAADLSASVFERWCESLSYLSPNTRRSRQLIVRKFCLYRRRSEPDCFVPNPLYFARRHPYRPIIVEPAPIACMLAVADEATPTPGSPCCRR